MTCTIVFFVCLFLNVTLILHGGGTQDNINRVVQQLSFHRRHTIGQCGRTQDNLHGSSW